MLANSEGRVGETILILMVILFFFGIVFMFILDSMMSGGWGEWAWEVCQVGVGLDEHL